MSVPPPKSARLAGIRVDLRDVPPIRNRRSLRGIRRAERVTLTLAPYLVITTLVVVAALILTGALAA